MNPYLHDIICDICLWWCVAFVAWALFCIIYQPLVACLKRLLRWAVRKLDRIVSTAQNRQRRQKTAHPFRVKEIPGTTGYKIMTR